jgi:ORF6N domain
MRAFVRLLLDPVSDLNGAAAVERLERLERASVLRANQAVKRNRKRFPEDFTFRLTRDEASEIAGSRSQSVILKRGGNIKYLPYVFTEHGAIMAANVLNSPHAVRMSVYVVRAFIRLRHTVELQRDIMAKLEELERAVIAHDTDIKRLFAALRQLMAPPDAKTRKIGFLVEEKAAAYGRR